MANLFFIHTPLQLMVAQLIIRQESLQDNVMLYGYVDNNVQFLDIYDLTIIEELWSKRVAFPQVSNWAGIARKHVIRDGNVAFQHYRHISKVIRDYHIDSVFLGDMWNKSCQLTAMAFHRKGMKISFFEEGNGHYILKHSHGEIGSFADKVYALMIDAFYYLPFFGVRMGYITFWKGFELGDLPMDVRYSVVPFYHEEFDKLLTVKPVVSDKLKQYIAKEVMQIGQKASILLMTTPLYEWMGERNKKDEEIYVNTIVNYMKSLEKGTCVHIKFHPREKEHIRKKLMMELAKADIGYVILGREINIPAEYYLQYIHYEKIVMFLSSTAFYNGYLFPKVQFESLLEDYYNNCKVAGSQSVGLLEPLLKEIPNE